MENSYNNLLELQRRCTECGSSSNLEIHHRIFRSQAPDIRAFLEWKLIIYREYYKKDFNIWGLNNVQNLVLLCNKCHTKIHSWDKLLRNKYKDSFTCEKTGLNLFFENKRTLY